MKTITTNQNILNENSELLQMYFKDVYKYPVISGEEQLELARRMKKGDESARNLLINSNLRFVVTCAKQYVGQGVSLMDLINAGNMGLIQSCKNFDPDKGYKFLSFAVWYIRREIIKCIYNNGRTIRYPITYISKITKVKKEYEKFVSENHREPTEDELLKLTNFSQKQYDSVIMDKSYCESFDTPITEDSTLKDVIKDSSVSLDSLFIKDSIEKCLKVLNSREYKVITEFYGLNGESEHSIKEIAIEMGLGDERVRQLRKSGIKKLREKQGNILKSLL